MMTEAELKEIEELGKNIVDWYQEECTDSMHEFIDKTNLLVDEVRRLQALLSRVGEAVDEVSLINHFLEEEA